MTTYVTPGHPVAAGAGYDCHCGECLHRRARLAEDGHCPAPEPAPLSRHEDELAMAVYNDIVGGQE